MSSIQVRPFRRSDRDQLTQLVNAHAGAVVPGLSVSVNTVLASLERQSGEFIEDPWVAERVTLVAEQQDRVAAAAHLLRYFCDERAGVTARDLGDISWLLYWARTPLETFSGTERLARAAGWADVGNLQVSEPYRRRGVGSWLLGQAAGWLELAHIDRLLDYAWLDGTDPGGVSYEDYRAFLPAVGFRELTRTQRGWTRGPERRRKRTGRRADGPAPRRRG